MNLNPYTAVKCLALATLFSLALGSVSGIAEEGMTYSALQVAHERELDCRSQYLAFAARADLEGHATAACLLWARGAERTHEALFRVALGTLDREESRELFASTSPDLTWLPSPGDSAATFYLCTGDGSVFSSPVIGACRNCGTGAVRVLAIDYRH
jgi:hypothetical protein